MVDLAQPEDPNKLPQPYVDLLNKPLKDLQAMVQNAPLDELRNLVLSIDHQYHQANASDGEGPFKGMFYISATEPKNKAAKDCANKAIELDDLVADTFKACDDGGKTDCAVIISNAFKVGQTDVAAGKKLREFAGKMVDMYVDGRDHVCKDANDIHTKFMSPKAGNKPAKGK
jgi:hypothetical protein